MLNWQVWNSRFILLSDLEKSTVRGAAWDRRELAQRRGGCTVVPAPPVLSPGLQQESEPLPQEQPSSLPGHLPNTPNHPYFYCHQLRRQSLLGEVHGSVSHHSLCTKTTVQEALCFARLFCPVGTLLLVGTLLMALNFCEKTSGEQTLQARYALAGHRKWSRLLFSACPLASSCLASWVLRKVSPRTDFLVFSFYICFYQTPSFIFVTFRSCFRLHQYPARYLTCHISADAPLLS